jgi:GWxTD domain-containing protein
MQPAKESWVFRSVAGPWRWLALVRLVIFETMIRRTLAGVPPKTTMIRLFLLAALSAAAAPAASQSVDIREIFTNEWFYQSHGILQGRGDVDFVADVWVLPGPADSSRALIGVGLPNSELEFVRGAEGGWHADYVVVAALEPEAGAHIEQRWERSFDVASFDETMVPGEMIVFQTELVLAPGEYDLQLTVQDRNAEEASRVETRIEVPRPVDASLSEPVLLRSVAPGEDGVRFLVHPSHTFPTAPERIDFLVAADASPAMGSLVARAQLLEADPDDRGAPLATWSDTLVPQDDGGLRAFGALESDVRFGEYVLEVTLVDATGAELARSATPLLVAGSSAWIIEHWKDALSLIRYEATEEELEILEDIDDPAARVEAWACFWRMRDPISATHANEAMQEYFGRIQTANETWKSALRPGYQSDRGRVFVTLGPPADIQSNPMPRDSEPYEVWTYFRGRQFQLLFVDRIGFNNYQLDSMGTYQRELSEIERPKRQFLRDRSRLCPVLQPAFERED